MRIFEKGFNYSQDGPGNRLVLHLSGCNLHCPWCSNPEGLFQSGTEYSVEDIFAEIVSCKPMFFDGGGVTFTGGECTLQSEELSIFIDKLHDEKINVCIETNASTDGFLRIFEKVDYLIIDYKCPDADILKNITGADLSVIEKNIFTAIGSKFLHIRIPFIDGFNTHLVDDFIVFFEKLQKNSSDFDVEILPYHEYGKVKWEKLGQKYKYNNGKVTNQEIHDFEAKLREKNIKVRRS
jgi:pyruvate formate lyase activating enzyme